MTTRIDHTGCSHSATPKGRAYCRNLRREAIKAAQAQYNVVASVDQAERDQYDEYYALVENVAYHCGVELRQAYEIVENGPVL